jgi:hypothetical protein
LSAEISTNTKKLHHFGLRIGESARDLLLMCMRGALEELVANAKRALSLFLADWGRNQPNNPHDAGRTTGRSKSREGTFVGWS